jgi:hypothetical protein
MTAQLDCLRKWIELVEPELASKGTRPTYRQFVSVLAGHQYHEAREGLAKLADERLEKYVCQARRVIDTRRQDFLDFSKFKTAKQHWNTVLPIFREAFRAPPLRPYPEPGCRLFTTTGGYVGTCRNACPGDELVLVVGCKAPVLLREGASGYSFVGVALVAELMEGQGWDENIDVESLRLFTLSE